MDRYTKENVIRNIRDYYNPAPHEVALGKTSEAFERARLEYIQAMKGAIKSAQEITFSDMFHKSKA